jgi:proteasome lid subunit RPN8/RPN11
MALTSVTVPPRIVAGLRRHAAAALPAECCGALIGAIHRDRREIRTMIPLANQAVGPDRYSIDARTVLRLERQAACIGLSVIGFYHSHPGGAALPSATDLEHACPGYLYLIVAAGGLDLRAWRLRDDRHGFAELVLLDPVAGAA